MSAVWNLDNPAFASFAFYSTVLAIKMILMAPVTGYYRMSRGAFANPEDAKKFGAKGTKTDADVERVRRSLRVGAIFVAALCILSTFLMCFFMPGDHITAAYSNFGRIMNTISFLIISSFIYVKPALMFLSKLAHQNDLENIPVFFLIASVYLLTNPSAFVATTLFRVFTVGRILHSVLYLNGSSLRPLGFVIPQLVSFYMAGSALYHLW